MEAGEAREAVVSEERRFPKEKCLLAKRLPGLKREKNKKKTKDHPSSRLNLRELSVTLSSSIILVTSASTSDILSFQMLCSV